MDHKTPNPVDGVSTIAYRFATVDGPEEGEYTIRLDCTHVFKPYMGLLVDGHPLSEPR